MGEIENLLAEAEQKLNQTTKPALAWFDAQQMPTLRWKTGEVVPPTMLSYLLLCQAGAKTVLVTKDAGQVVALIDKTTSADFALALFNGWLSHRAEAKEAWCLPLSAALADERFISSLRRQID